MIAYLRAHPIRVIFGLLVAIFALYGFYRAF